jgi:hypothetical protein
MLKQSWADFWPEAAWRWPSPTAITGRLAQAKDAAGHAPARVTARSGLTTARPAAAPPLGWQHELGGCA